MIIDIGLGEANAAQITNTAIQGGGAIASAAITASGYSVFGLAPLVAVPVIGAAIAGITILVNIWLGGIARRNKQKDATTQIVNEAEPLLVQNRDAYLSSNQHTQGEKDQALYNFDAIWGQVVNACGSGAYADAGKRCLGDRQRGGQWDWFSYYRDPIANSSVVSAAEAIGLDAGKILNSVEQATGFTQEVIIWGAATIAALLLIKTVSK